MIQTKHEKEKPWFLSISYFLHMRICLTMNESTESAKASTITLTHIWSLKKAHAKLATILFVPLGKQGGHCGQSPLHHLLHVWFHLYNIGVRGCNFQSIKPEGSLQTLASSSSPPPLSPWRPPCQSYRPPPGRPPTTSEPLAAQAAAGRATCCCQAPP